MRKIRKRTFAELVMENKRQLLNDVSALEKLEEKWKHVGFIKQSNIAILQGRGDEKWVIKK